MAEDREQSVDEGKDHPEGETIGSDANATDQSEESLGRVLSQEEIESLLGTGDNEENTSQQGWRILLDSSKISYERLPMLEVVFDRLVRLLSTSLRNFTSDNVEISIQNMTSIRFGEYLNSIPLPCLINVFKIEEWSTPGLLTIDASFIYSIVDVLLGGRRCAPITKLDGRPFTTIECNLVQRLVNLILADFTKAFEPVAPIRFHFERMETNPRFATIVRPVNAAILTTIRVEMENRGGTFEFMIPYSTIEPAREQLLQMFMGEKTGQESIWESHFSNEIWDATVSLDAILDRITLSLNEVLAWRPGTQVVLRAKPESIIDMVCGDSRIFSGQMGQSDGYISIRVEENFIKSRAKT